MPSLSLVEWTVVGFKIYFKGGAFSKYKNRILMKELYLVCPRSHDVGGAVLIESALKLGLTFRVGGVTYWLYGATSLEVFEHVARG